MYGTKFARGIARSTQAGIRALDGPDGVLAVVLASTVITSVCAFVIVLNTVDAQRAAATQARTMEATPPPAPARIYPDAGTFDTTVSVVIDRAPGVRMPPALGPLDIAQGPALRPNAPVTVIEGRPPVAPLPRPGDGQSPALAAGTDPSQPSTLLAGTSPRPSLRPADLVTRVAARADQIDIEVARADTPDALGGIGESPRPSIFNGGGTGACSVRLASDIPRRPGSATGGAAVMASAGNGSGSGRDDRMVQEALSGNVPSHIRDLQPVTFNGTVGGRSVDVTICVTPDYLAIGSDSDNVRVPLGLPAALRVAEAFDMMLPTTAMVDAIYQQADVRIAPSPMTPGSSMSSTNYFLRHNETVNGQFARAGARSGMLVAGHKKDLVLANRLSRNPGRVAIYGWHRTNGSAIQPLSTVHGEYYADYSHGVRLVSRTAFVDGRAVDLRELLTDERYAGFLNSDGALTGATVRLASL